MKRTKEEALITRENLLSAALRVFSKEGYSAARLEDIAQAAGVTRGAIYHHFGGKEELFIDLLNTASEISNQAIQKAVEEGGNLLKVLTRIIVNTFNLLEDDARFRQVMALSLTQNNIPGLAQRKYKEAEQLVQTISKPLKTGVIDGDLRPDLNPENAARALLAYQNGFAMLWFVNRDAFSVKENAEALAKIYLYGIAKT